MSLIKEALEKAGRKLETLEAAAAETIIRPPVPAVRFSTPVREQRIKNWVQEEASVIPIPQTAKEKINFWKVLKTMKPVSVKIPQNLKLPFDFQGDLAAIAAILGVLILGLSFLTLYRTVTTADLSVPAKSLATGVPDMISKTALAPKFALTGITDSNTGKLALINNQVVGVGDKLKENALVKTIAGRSVVLYFHGKEITLSL